MEEVLSVVLSKEKETEKSHGSSLLASWLPRGAREEPEAQGRGPEAIIGE